MRFLSEEFTPAARLRLCKNGVIMYNVLMVDDDLVILENNKTYFNAMGYEVVCAATATAAEKIILSNALDCVILDVDLPDMSAPIGLWIL